LVESDAVLDGIAAEPAFLPGREQRRILRSREFGEPTRQHRDGGRGKRGDPVLSSLAVTGDMGSCAKVQVAAGQAGEFGHSESGLDSEEK